MSTFKTVLLTVFVIGACDNSRAPLPERRQAQADLDRAKLEAAAAKDQNDRSVVNPAERVPVRGVDEAIAPDPNRWRGWWSAFAANPYGIWSGEDWIVERHGHEAFKGYRKLGTALDVRDKVDDQALKAAVQARLAGAMLGTEPINVSSKDGKVSLVGNVANLDQVGEAMRVALGTHGVTEVETNLHVQ